MLPPKRPLPSLAHQVLLVLGLALVAVFLACGGSSSSSGPADVAPSITTQPQAGSVALGAPATFTGAATGTPMPTLAWQRSNDGGKTWAAVAGATTATYTLAAATLDDNNAQFRLAATNGAGTTDSSAAPLTVTATAGQSTQIQLPMDSGPTGTTLGPDGNIWFTNQTSGQIGTLDAISHALTTVTLRDPDSMPTGITSGPDGRIWFTEQANGKIGAVTLPGDTVTEYPSTGLTPTSITTGPDGALWYTLPGSNAIGRMTPAGAAAVYPLLTPAASPASITLGTDGNLWFTESAVGQIGQITPAGLVTEWAIPTPSGGVMPVPQGILATPDGTLWVADSANGQLVKITPPAPGTTAAHLARTAPALLVFATVQLPGGSAPLTLALDASGNVWAVDSGTGQMSSVTPDGTVTNFTLPTSIAELVAGATLGPDGSIYLAVPGGNIIVQFIPAPPPTAVTIYVQPGLTQVLPGQTVQYAAVVLGSPDTSATWGIQEGNAGGTINAQGLYTAPATGGLYHIIGTSNADPAQSAVAAVNVESGPSLARFTAEPTAILPGGTSVLTGTFTNGSGVITPGNLPAVSGTGVTVAPTETTTYTLTVTNTAGVASLTVTVTVSTTLPPPVITSFMANPTSIPAGGNALLSATFTGGTGVIDPGGLAVTSGTGIVVYPAETTAYTLTVTNAQNVSVTQGVVITVTGATAPGLLQAFM